MNHLNPYAVLACKYYKLHTLLLLGSLFCRAYEPEQNWSRPLWVNPKNFAQKLSPILEFSHCLIIIASHFYGLRHNIGNWIIMINM